MVGKVLSTRVHANSSRALRGLAIHGEVIDSAEDSFERLKAKQFIARKR